MEEHLHVSNIEALVKEIKREMLMLDIDPYSFVSPSAYDTAWLAMVEYSGRPPSSPMFKGCLDWLLNNQTAQGYWGDSDAHGSPTIDSLPATLASVVALKKWNLGDQNVERGLDFVRGNAEKLLGVTNHEEQNYFSRWFTIVFPAMIELAPKVGLHLDLPPQLNGLLADISFQRQRILESEPVVGSQYPPLLSYLEALPSTYDVSEEEISTNLSSDGSLFGSPAATARAFMATGKEECLAYLESLVGRCTTYGVPPRYPMDEELIRLCVINQIQRLGLADHFTKEIEHNLAQLYRKYNNQEPISLEKPNSITHPDVASQLHKDSLAFRLLRMHGHRISPSCFCWFLNDQEIEVEENYEHLWSAMLNVYRATDLKFPGECEVEEARSFARKLLHKALIFLGTSTDHKHKFGPAAINLIKQMMEHELRLPWISRLDHLEHRTWIQEKNNNILWLGNKASFLRLSPLLQGKLMQLAVADYRYRQSIYRNELEEVKRWSRSRGLVEMGFGREKTTYCYFGIASSIPLPYESDVRMIITKSAVVITVADDFYDTEGCLDELNCLTHAIRRWDGNGLSGHSKTIFDALDHLVREIVAKVLQHQGTDITTFLRHIWHETFLSWLEEAKWSRGGIEPSMDEYLRVGAISIAAHTLVLPASYLLNPSLKLDEYCKIDGQYHAVTKLLMIIPRLLNDIQSYQKEQEEGKMNSVLLYMKEKAGAVGIEESRAYVRGMVDSRWAELVQNVVVNVNVMDIGNGDNYLPKPMKLLHLSCVKVFEMFFHSTNRYDSNTAMLQDIQNAIYIPLSLNSNPPFLTYTINMIPFPNQHVAGVNQSSLPNQNVECIYVTNPAIAS